MELKIFGKTLTIDCGCDLRQLWITKWWAGLSESSRKHWLGKTFKLLGFMVTIDANGNVTKVKDLGEAQESGNRLKRDELQAQAMAELENQ